MDRSVISADLFAFVLLLAWIAAGFALVRRAERRLGRPATAPPWSALASCVALGVVALMLLPPERAVACAVACIALVLAAGADYRTGYLFDAITFPTALVVTALAIGLQNTQSAAWGVAALVVPFGALVFATRGRLMGLGDVKAMFSVGAAFGPVESLIAIFAASLSGIVAALLSGNLRRGAEVRFGPHLAIGAAVALVAGGPIARYLAVT